MDMTWLFQNMTWLLLEGSFENEKQQFRIWMGKKWVSQESCE